MGLAIYFIFILSLKDEGQISAALKMNQVKFYWGGPCIAEMYPISYICFSERLYKCINLL